MTLKSQRSVDTGSYSADRQSVGGESNGSGQKKYLPRLAFQVLDENDPDYQKFFKSMSNKMNKLEPQKLETKIFNEFGALGPQLYNIIKREFNNFKFQIDQKEYSECINKFIAKDDKNCKAILFNLLDKNKDKYICETDLFHQFQLFNDMRLHRLLQDDIQQTLKFLE